MTDLATAQQVTPALRAMAHLLLTHRPLLGIRVDGLYERVRGLPVELHNLRDVAVELPKHGHVPFQSRIRAKLVIVVDFGNEDPIPVQKVLHVLKLPDTGPNLVQRTPSLVDKAVQRHIPDRQTPKGSAEPKLLSGRGTVLTSSASTKTVATCFQQNQLASGDDSDRAETLNELRLNVKSVL
jgi:primosomal protein N'